jgi:hypothetical protein
LPRKPERLDGARVLVSIRGLKTYYSLRGSFVQRLVGRDAGYVKAVDDVSLELRRGEVLGLVGESGSGSFHPRCPLAFEVCGWEARDLRDLLEARWALQAQERYEAEQALMGDLSALDEPSTHARLKAGAAKTGADAVALLEEIREDAPDERFWVGVRRIAADGEHVDIEWFDPIAPRPLARGEATVECLFDDDALAEADRRRAVRSASEVGA